MLHKDFRDFDLDIFLEIFLVCVVRLIFLHKLKDSIHMPRRLMNDLEGEICDEELCEGALGNNILSADLDSEEVLLLNIRDHRVSGVAHDLTP